MEYVTLGNSGLKISRLCLGCMSFGTPRWRPWVLPEEEGRKFIRRALELGITFFDTADMYSDGVSEEILGRAIREFARREEVVIATKVFYTTGPGQNEKGLSRKHIMDAVDASLKRLRMDFIDLYQIHRWDRETPIEETMRALDDLVRAGKVRYLGASSMYAYQLAHALHAAGSHGWTTFISMQNHYNLAYREEEREMIPLCREEHIGLIPWSPLARGFLTGSRRRGSRDATVREQSDAYAHNLYYQESDYVIADRVAELAQRRHVSPATIALAWLLRAEGVAAPIVGTTKMHHLDDAVAALDCALDARERTFLEECYQPHRILGH